MLFYYLLRKEKKGSNEGTGVRQVKLVSAFAKFVCTHFVTALNH